MKDLNGLDIDLFLDRISTSYHLKKMEKIHNPIVKDEISMYLDGCWYSLIAKENSYESSKYVYQLDPDILSKNILEPILGIEDIKNVYRIDFIDGKQGLQELQDIVDSEEYRVAFALKPITFNQLKQVADKNEIMPPKSTYISKSRANHL